MKTFSRTLAVASCVLLMSCATQIKPSKTINPPPTEAFAAFDQFELRPVMLAPAFSDQGVNQRAAAKIQEYFDGRVKQVIDGWNAKGSGGARTLVIEPSIEQIKFIGIGARIFVGAMAGSSAVLMRVKYTDRGTGRVIANPEFYQRVSAMSGAHSFGGQDNAMLARIATLVADYNERNFGSRVGGDKGMMEDADL